MADDTSTGTDNAKTAFNSVKGAFRVGIDGRSDGNSSGSESSTDTSQLNWNDADVGSYSFASGFGVKASGLASVAFGKNVTASGQNSTIFGTDGPIVSGSYSLLIGNNMGSGFAGDYSVFIGDNQDIQNSPSYSLLIGNHDNNPSAPSLSHLIALGDNYNSPGGSYSLTLGNQNNASKAYSIAIGNASNTANGDHSIAIGQAYNQSEQYSIAIGNNYNHANSKYSLALGNNGNRTGADHSIAVGSQANSTTGEYSLALGTNANTAAAYSIAVGDEDNRASGIHSLAMGTHKNWATGVASIAIGGSAVTSDAVNGEDGNEASGDYSVAIGQGNLAYGGYSFAKGDHTVALSYGETAIGVYPTIYTPADTSGTGTDSKTSYHAADRLFVVGNGVGPVTSALNTNRSDAFVIYKDGHATLAGALTSPSDKRLKTNITKLLNTLDKLSKLNGVKYDWIPKENRSKKPQIGLIAQELQEQYPELVDTDDKGYLSVNYGQFSAVLLQAINEQQAIIKAQDEKLNNLDKKVDFLMSKVTK